MLYIIPADAGIKVSCSKLLKVLEDVKTPYLFTGLECFLREKDAFLTCWRGKSDHLLVIADDTTQSDTRQDFMNNLLQILNEEPKKRVVFVSPEDKKFLERFGTELGDRFQLVRDDFKLSQLTSVSLEKALQSKVTFQGREVEKGGIVGDSPDSPNRLDKLDRLPSEVTNFVVSSITEPIGKVPPELKHKFIQRTLTRPNLKKSIFKSINLMDEYAISGITEDELQRLVPKQMQSYTDSFSRRNDDTKSKIKINKDTRFLVLTTSNASNDFSQLCKPNQSVHWLHMENEKLTWKKSHGSISEILQFVDEDQFSEYNPSTLLDISDRIVLLIAEPGMGKTSLLTHLAHQSKKTNPSEWVVHISLNDYPHLLDETLCSDFKPSEFMASVAYTDEKSQFQHSLFEHSLRNNGNITICIDGVDEISESCLTNFELLLTHLLESNVKKICITSRHLRGPLLENLTSSIAFSIQMFTREDQVRYLEDHWSDINTTMNNQQQKEFINQIIALVNSSISYNQRHIMGIPLQTKMLADIFQLHFENPNESNLPEKLDVLTIYEKCVDKKYTIAYEEKCKIDLVRNRKGYRVHCEDSNRDHMAAALVVLLGKQYLPSLHDKTLVGRYDKFVKDLESGDEKNGVIVQVVNGRTQFVHNTFAEYFGGIWLADNYRFNKSLLVTHFCREEFQMVRNIFDRKLSSENPLHIAVLNGDVSQVESLLDSGKDVNSRDLGGRTALHLAATLGPQDPSQHKVNLKIINTILTKGADITLQDEHVLQWTPLRYADETEAYEVIETILEHEATKRIDVADIYKEMRHTIEIINDKSKLALIIKNGYHQIMDCLLKNGLDVNTKLDDYYESSIIHTTTRWGHGPLLTLLIQRGASLMSRDKKNQTPLHIAAGYGQHDLLEILIKSIPNKKLPQCVNTPSTYGVTAMHLAALGGHVDIMRLLVSVGGDLESLRDEGRTLLHIAASNCHLTVCQYLLENISHNKDIVTQYVNTHNSDEYTAMHFAALVGHVDVMRLLHRAGGDLESLGYNGTTLLQHAALNGHLTVCRYLLENISHDKDIITQYVNTLDTDEDTAMHKAALGGNVDIMRLLVSVGGDLESRGGFKVQTLLHRAANGGHLSVCQYLLENISHDRDIITQYVNTRDTYKDTAMHVTAQQGHVDVMRLLVSVGGDLESRGFNDRTLLHSAAYKGHLSVCRYLLENISHDKDIITQYVNTRNTDEYTAMHLAARGGHVDVMRLLVSVGGDIKACTSHNSTTLTLAAQFGHASVVELILDTLRQEPGDNIVFINTLDNYGYSAVLKASCKGYLEIVKLLSSEGADVTLPNKAGITALHVAVLFGHRSVVEVLLESFGGDNEAVEAFLDARDKLGQSALYYAERQGHAEVANLLRYHQRPRPRSTRFSIFCCTYNRKTSI